MTVSSGQKRFTSRERAAEATSTRRILFFFFFLLRRPEEKRSTDANLLVRACQIDIIVARGTFLFRYRNSEFSRNCFHDQKAKISMEFLEYRSVER